MQLQDIVSYLPFHLTFKYQCICSQSSSDVKKNVNVKVMMLLCFTQTFMTQKMRSINQNEFSDWTAKAINIFEFFITKAHSAFIDYIFTLRHRRRVPYDAKVTVSV